MKKVFLFLVICMFFSLNMQAQTATGVVLSSDTIILLTTDAPQDTSVIAHVLPSNATTKQVEWNILSGNNSVISTTMTLSPAIIEDTTFTFSSVDVGEALIEVREDFSNKKAVCVVLVVTPADDIGLNKTTLSMTIDDVTNASNELVATISPPDATGVSVIWENLYEDLVEIDTTGNVCNIRALARGTAKVVAKTYYYYDQGGTLFEEFTDTCVITISAEAITDLTLTGPEGATLPDLLELTIDDEYELTAHLIPTVGIVDSVHWKSSDHSVVGFISSQFGAVYDIKAVGVGTAEVVAIAYQTEVDNPLDVTQWATDTVKIRVYGERATGMSLDIDTIRVNRTETAQLIATVMPSNTTDKTIDWIIDGPDNITLSTPGGVNDTICEITAHWSDTTKVIAISLDNDEFRDTCVVIVYVPVDSVVFKIADISISDTVDMEISDTIRLKATVFPDTATIKSVTWTIRDPLLIEQEFIVHDTVCDIIALKYGNAQIKATVTDREVINEDSCIFRIDYKPITGINLTLPDTVEIFKFEEQELTVTVLPFLAANDSVIWISSDSAIIDILTTGFDTICIIKALSIDTATITVTSKADPGLTASCVFVVNMIPVEEVILPQDTLKLYLGHKMNLTATVLPWDATDKSLTWTSKNPTIVEIISPVNDTVCEILGKELGYAMIYAVAHDGVAEDSCVILVRDQFVFLESDTTNINGGIELSLLIPEGVLLSGSFELQLPKGFGLTKGEVSLFRSCLADDLKDIYDLDIQYVNDSTYIFTINAITTLPPSHTGDTLKLLDIIYTIYNNGLEGSSTDFLVKIVDVVFDLSNDTAIEEDMVSVVVKSFRDPTVNEIIDKFVNFAYIFDNRLYVNTDKAETISVYSLNGSLLFTGNKKEGQAIFNISTPEQILIVKGSSGWANKVSNK